MSRRHHIAVGISGGVDSAVAALLLQQQGHAVTGVFMKNWEEDDTDSHCAAAEDVKAARAVCEHLGIPLKTVNFAADYWERVFERFLAEHRAGRTPNPDILCNSEIKFKAFLDYARDLGADRIATGHYARIDARDGRTRLLKARDENKDQSYFLHALPQAALAHASFPVGELTKSEVRARAHAAGLPNYNRPDSTGICFIGERNYKIFLERFLPAQPGEMRTPEGESKGRHDGLMYYTLGQRHGLGLGGAGPAWYVVGKDMASNTLYVAQGEHHPALYHDALIGIEPHWIHAAPLAPCRLMAKTRYRQSDQACTVAPLSGNRARVTFDVPQRALTPGQSVVFYDGEECLGGAVIDTTASGAVGSRMAAG
jgi:tRNA-uridine 2-sulfurtransferase